MRKDLLDACDSKFHTDPKHKVLHEDLQATIFLNDRIKQGEYKRQSEIAFFYVQIQWHRSGLPIRSRRQVIAIRWCRQSFRLE